MIVLSEEQVVEVVRDATAGRGLARLLSTVGELEELRELAEPLLDDPSYARTTLRALLVLLAFPADGGERELTDVAAQLGLSPSTTHRYVNTWTAIGVLQQDLHSRRYRRTVPDQPGGAG
jgi:IclR helix-turn-helix domain